MSAPASRASTALADDALTAYLAGVAACDGTKLVKAGIRSGALDDWFGDRNDPRPLHVLAVGKAAPAMAWGLMEANVPFSGIGVTTETQRRPQLEGFRWCVGDHPVPGPGSFAAGDVVWDWAARLPDDARVLVLLSGGASALIESGDPDAINEVALQAAATGTDIVGLNEARAQVSQLKGGRLGAFIRRRTPYVRVWMLQDTPPGQERWVGSGPFWDEADPNAVPHHTLADNARAIDAVGQALAAAGYAPFRFPTRLSGDTESAVATFLAAFEGLGDGRVALIGGGETTHPVPPGSPGGGRCQHAALIAAMHLAQRPGALFFAAGTDGIDGNTKEAGAWVDGNEWAGDRRRAEAALHGMDAHGFLADHGRTVRSGPSATNVNDIWIVLQR